MKLFPSTGIDGSGWACWYGDVRRMHVNRRQVINMLIMNDDI